MFTSELKPGMVVTRGFPGEEPKTVAFTEIKPCSYFIRFTDGSGSCSPRDYPGWEEVNDDRNSESGVDKQPADHR